MLNQFSRTQLLCGEEAMKRLRNARVAECNRECGFLRKFWICRRIGAEK